MVIKLLSTSWSNIRHMLIQSRSLQTCFGGDYHHHLQGRRHHRPKHSAVMSLSSHVHIAILSRTPCNTELFVIPPTYVVVSQSSLTVRRCIVLEQIVDSRKEFVCKLCHVTRVKECVLVSCCWNHCWVLLIETVTFPSIPRMKPYVNRHKLRNLNNVKIRVALACSAMDLLVGR